MKTRSYQIVIDMLTENRGRLYAQWRQGQVICSVKIGAGYMPIEEGQVICPLKTGRLYVHWRRAGFMPIEDGGRQDADCILREDRQEEGGEERWIS